jgi:hypothetical protein
MTIPGPSFGERRPDNGTTMPLAPEFRMGYDIVEICMLAAAAQKVRCGDEHAGSGNPAYCF